MAFIQPSFTSFHSSFQAITGANSSASIYAESKDGRPLFHEAGVYIASTSSLYVTSNQFTNPATGKPQVVISRVNLADAASSCTVDSVDTDIVMANGGVNYKNGILFCDQGDLEHKGGLVYVEPLPAHKSAAQEKSRYRSSNILNDFYGVPFNSLNDVVVAKDGAIWFTDPPYGYEQGFRAKPQLPAMVYRFDPSSRSVRAMADGFGRPNGLAFSPDESVLYVTDTDHIHGDGTIDPARASTIYAFTIFHTSSEPTLINRRLFAFATSRCPDGIKCDTLGNVYAGCLDGISVWNSSGVLLGKILIPGGVANFCFARAGEIMALGETKLWRIMLGEGVAGALLA